MVRIAYFAASISALLSLTACGETADRSAAQGNTAVAPVSNGAAAPAMTTGQAFADTAASSDAFEIETSKLAGEKSQSATVQAFAKRMIAAHTESTAKLKAAAASATPAITPDPALTTEQQAKIAALQEKSGAAFDTAYATEQVIAHQMTLDRLRAYSSSGDVPQLKAFAASMTPVVAEHLDMAKSLKP